MQEKLNEIMKYAHDTGKKVIARIKKDEDMDEKKINIESYDGDDASYSGSEEEYEEFLKSVDGKMNSSEEAEPVENTQKINLNLGDTVNIQNVIDKFKKKAGEFTTAAKNVKDDVSGKIEDFKAATGEKSDGGDEDDGETRFERYEKIAEDIKSFDVEGIKNQITDSVKGSMNKLGDVKEGLTSITERFNATDLKVDELAEKISEVSGKADAIAEKLQLIEISDMENGKEQAQNYAEIRHTIGGMVDDIVEIKQTVVSVSKLNDSIFDLKNAQINTKNSIAELETGFIKLKRKCIASVTILSILSAIIIALEILQLLS